MKRVLSFSRFATVAALVLIGSTAGAATFPVTNVNDSGPGSLSQAITDANNVPGDDTIIFDLPGNGPHLIALSNSLPALVSNISIINDASGDEAVTVLCWKPTTIGRKALTNRP